jgi:tight adherence protein B
MANELWIIYGLVFGAALLGVQAFYWVVVRSRSERKIINRRLTLTAQLKDQGAVLEALRKERGGGALADIPGTDWLHELVIQSGVKLDIARVSIWMIGLTAAFYLGLEVSLRLGTLGIFVAFPLALIAAYVLLRRARARRIRKFTEQLPEALDVVVRGLRAGHPFRVALGLAAREMADPIGTEFGILLDEISFGLDQQLAVDHLYRRVGQDDLSLVSTAINIQSQTGGNLADVLQSLSRMLRSRAKLQLKVRALTSEGRLSGVILTVLPFVFFMMINLLNPGYYAVLKGHPVTVPAVVVGLLLLVVGNFAIRRMVNFKV